MMDLSRTVSTPVVQRHKASGEVWRRIGLVSASNGGRWVVRVQREGKQRVLWLTYWRDAEIWEEV